jgi:hypothetical protein
METYEQRLDRNFEWALREGSMHFEQGNAVHKALRKITKRLDELGIPYAVVGAMAMFFHGYRRFTDDVDLLVTSQGLADVPSFHGSKQPPDTENGVKIEFLVTGEYPGDGKPKPVAFPKPEESSLEIQGIHFLQLPKIIELKLASGMTNPGRRKDLGDVQELIRELKLPLELSSQLNPFVQSTYNQIWNEVRSNPA